MPEEILYEDVVTFIGTHLHPIAILETLGNGPLSEDRLIKEVATHHLAKAIRTNSDNIKHWIEECSRYKILERTPEGVRKTPLGDQCYREAQELGYNYRHKS